jgi:hypothetical protein
MTVLDRSIRRTCTVGALMFANLGTCTLIHRLGLLLRRCFEARVVVVVEV